MRFVVQAVPAEEFSELVALSDPELAERGVEIHVADSKPGYPCRVSLRDAEPGEQLYLVNYTHHDVPGPYRASHAIFVRRDAQTSTPAPGEVPEMLRLRQLSVRAFDAAGSMVDAAVAPGAEAEETFARLLQLDQVAYLHVHTAARGCYLARVHPGA